MSPTAKRALFQTPTRSNKRSRTMKARGMAVGSSKIPKALLPETKQYLAASLSTSGFSDAYSPIPEQMTQGDSGSEFLGSKFRVMRLRVNYDWSAISLSGAVRLSVVIPKDPTTNPALTSSRQQWDTNTYTVLHDMLIPPDSSLTAGTFDVKGPINVEMDATGSAPRRNNICIYVFNTGNGAALASDISYSCWFTG